MARCWCVNMGGHINTKVVGIKFKPKKRDHTFELTK